MAAAEPAGDVGETAEDGEQSQCSDSSWKSCHPRKQRAKWGPALVEEIAGKLYVNLPNGIHDLVTAGTFKGGPLIKTLQSDPGAPSTLQKLDLRVCKLNKIWLRPFCDAFPRQVPTAALVADVLLMLDQKHYKGLLIKPRPHVPLETKQTLALADGTLIKKMLARLRMSWRACPNSNDEDLHNLKSVLQPASKSQPSSSGSAPGSGDVQKADVVNQGSVSCASMDLSVEEWLGESGGMAEVALELADAGVEAWLGDAGADTGDDDSHSMDLVDQWLCGGESDEGAPHEDARVAEWLETAGLHISTYAVRVRRVAVYLQSFICFCERYQGTGCNVLLQFSRLNLCTHMQTQMFRT